MEFWQTSIFLLSVGIVLYMTTEQFDAISKNQSLLESSITSLNSKISNLNTDVDEEKTTRTSKNKQEPIENAVDNEVVELLTNELGVLQRRAKKIEERLAKVETHTSDVTSFNEDIGRLVRLLQKVKDKQEKNAHDMLMLQKQFDAKNISIATIEAAVLTINEATILASRAAQRVEENVNAKYVKTENTPENYFLFTDSKLKNLYRMDLKTDSYVIIPVSFHSNPIAIGYDPVEEQIYWTDVVMKQIRSVGISGGNLKTLTILANDSVPDGLAVDARSRLIFYTDAGRSLIAVVTMDGSASAVIVSTDIDKPRAIVLDPENSKMFWTDWGAQPKIETAQYDGTDRRVLVNSGLLWPNAIAVDTKAKLIFWGDAGTHLLEKVSIDGSGRKVIYEGRIAHYFGLVFHDNTLYYTDWAETSVMKVSANGGVSTTVGPQGFGRLNDIHLHTIDKNSPGKSVCSDNNGGCSHICIPLSENKRKCMCPSGKRLQSDGNNCRI